MKVSIEEKQSIDNAGSLLIYQNTKLIDQIRAEIQHRANLLNKLAQSGLDNDKISEVAFSLSSIDSYILKLQLDTNKELKKLHGAGIDVGLLVTQVWLASASKEGI